MKNGIPNKVAEFRLTKDLTQEELAKMVGVSRQSIISIEKEDCEPSVCLAIKIAKFFNKQVEEVFFLPN